MLLVFLLRFASRLLPLIAALCALVPVLGGREPASDAAWEQLGFGVCELPCFAGITPGQTVFYQVPDLLRRSIPVIGNHMFDSSVTVDFWVTLPDYQLAGVVNAQRSDVGGINLTAWLPFDQLIARLGMPDCVLVSTTNHVRYTTVVFWVREQVSIGALLGVNQRAITPDMRVRAVWLRAVDPDDCALPGAIPWQGFAAVWGYTRLAP